MVITNSHACFRSMLSLSQQKLTTLVISYQG